MKTPVKDMIKLPNNFDVEGRLSMRSINSVEEAQGSPSVEEAHENDFIQKFPNKGELKEATETSFEEDSNALVASYETNQ